MKSLEPDQVQLRIPWKVWNRLKPDVKETVRLYSHANPMADDDFLYVIVSNYRVDELELLFGD